MSFGDKHRSLGEGGKLKVWTALEQQVKRSRGEKEGKEAPRRRERPNRPTSQKQTSMERYA